MKKQILYIIILVTTISFSQEKEKTFAQDLNKKHEIKINALTLIAAKWIDASYEYLINEESSFGTALTLNTDSNESNLKYAITPYYRRYFSGKYSRGFFVEGFGMFFSARESFFINTNSNYKAGVGFGVSVGGKFVSKKGFTTELLLGVGRNLTKSEYVKAIGRIGISVGYRF